MERFRRSTAIMCRQVRKFSAFFWLELSFK